MNASGTGQTRLINNPAKKAFPAWQPSVASAYNEADLHCNGFVNAKDTTQVQGRLGFPPGPSGVTP